MKLGMGHRLAVADAVTEKLRQFIEQKVRSDRRTFVGKLVFEGAEAARSGDWETFYGKIRKLKQGKKKGPCRCSRE